MPMSAAPATGTGQPSASVTAGHPALVVQPGDKYIFLSVTVRNTGTIEIGTQTVTVTAPQGISFMSPMLTLSRSEDAGTAKECVYPGSLSADGRTLTVPGALLNMPPRGAGVGPTPPST